jgi:hypothetical protein
MEEHMTRLKIACAGFLAAASLFAAPAVAQEATQEPGVVGKNYPDSNYLRGGYGHHFSPRPGFYFRHQYPGPSVMIDMPQGMYGYYVGPETGPVWYGP